jgi:hypothetical protein
MNTWVHGHMVTWSHGHIDIRTHGHMDTWTPGHLDTWTHGHLDTWTHGHLDTAIFKPTISFEPVSQPAKFGSRSRNRGDAIGRSGKYKTVLLLDSYGI